MRLHAAGFSPDFYINMSQSVRFATPPVYRLYGRQERLRNPLCLGGGGGSKYFQSLNCFESYALLDGKEKKITVFTENTNAGIRGFQMDPYRYPLKVLASKAGPSAWLSASLSSCFRASAITAPSLLGCSPS